MEREYNKKYRIEASLNRDKWKHIATFHDGDDNRFGEPMDHNLMMREIESFRESKRGQEFKYIRLITDIKG